MITAVMTFDHRTPQAEVWRITCEVEGEIFKTMSSHGASNALCRVLVNAGVADQPLEVRACDGALCFTVSSIHEWARWTWLENAGETPRMVRWRPRPAERVEPAQL